MLAVAVAAATVSMPAAASPEPTWSLSGFGTVGVTSTSGAEGLGFRRNVVHTGSTSATSGRTDTRLGFQANWRGADRWDAAAQVVLQERPPGTPTAEAVEWAYASYRLTPETRVRIGRTGPDVFLFADSRNVGYALTWARPPVDFYGSVPVSSVDGADIEHRWGTDLADWRVRLTMGRTDASASLTTVGRLPIQARDLRSLTVVREQGALSIKASHLSARLRTEPPAGVLQFRAALDQVAALPVPGLAELVSPLRGNLWSEGPVHYSALGAHYDRGPWSGVAEASRLAVPGSPLDARAAYATLGYRHGRVTYYALASRIAPANPPSATPDLATPLTPVLGPQAAQQVQGLVAIAAAAGATYRYDQSTRGIGLRWDVTSKAALKMQADRITVQPAGAGLWLGAGQTGARATVLSVLVDFAWGS